MKTVGAAIVNWNSGELTACCIKSLEQSDYSKISVVVVDNGSIDGSAEKLERQFPKLTILRNEKNLGFAIASNQGIAWAVERGFDYVLVLNNDTTAAPDMVSRLVAEAAKYDDAAVVSAKIFFADTPQRLWFTVGKANLWTAVFSNPAQNMPDDGRHDSPADMGWMVVGCCALIPRRVTEVVGGFDERFFMYCEDLDWSLRCRELGFRLVLCPEAKMWHKVSASKPLSGLGRYLMTRNHLWTLRKHASYLQMLCVLSWLPLRSSKRMLDAVRNRQWTCIPAELKGLRDGLLAPLRTNRTNEGQD